MGEEGVNFKEGNREDKSKWMKWGEGRTKNEG
jgi:hypothetical protein